MIPQKFAPLVELDLPSLWRFLIAQNRPLRRINYDCARDDVRCGRLFGVVGSSGHFTGIGAVTPIMPDLLVAWIAVSPGGLHRPLPVHAIRSLLTFVSRVGRVVAVVSETDERAQRLVRAIGFRWVEAGNNGLGVWQWDRLSTG